jgi:tripartite-type tricarboxylate transporter receptor subunit TctC
MMKLKATIPMVTSLFLFTVGGLLLSTPRTACSEFPERPVTVLVGSDPGGNMDLGARALAIGAERYLGKPLVIENRGGGGGTVALGAVSAAKPDGYTLCCAPNTAIANTPLLQKMPFKPLKSFTPVLGYAIGQHTGLLVRSNSPWKTFKEFLEYARQNPGKIKYSSAGIGFGTHTIMEAIGKKEGVKWVHVPYKGNAPAVMALLGDHVDACSCDASFPQYVDAGTVRVLLAHGATRHPQFPDIPTAMELGYGVRSETIHSIIGPAGLPDQVVAKLAAAFKKGMETPEFEKTIATINQNPFFLGSKDYEGHLKEFWNRYEALFKDIGLITEPATQPY